MPKEYHRAEGQSQITFQLPTELKDRLTEAKKRTRRSMSNIIVIAVENYLNETEARMEERIAAEEAGKYPNKRYEEMLPPPVIKSTSQAESKRSS